MGTPSRPRARWGRLTPPSSGRIFRLLLTPPFAKLFLTQGPVLQVGGLPPPPKLTILAGLGCRRVPSDLVPTPARHPQTAMFPTEKAEPGPPWKAPVASDYGAFAKAAGFEF